MVTQQQIEQFLSCGPIAMAGVSRNPKKFGRVAFEELSRKGLKLIPVNPNIESINGEVCYPSVSQLPDDVKSLLVMTKKDQTARVIEEALAKGIKNIWIQQSSDTPEALALLKDKEVNLITKQCVLMHHQPDSFHKFHRNLKRFFGGLPK
ncbi:MAG: CoA-binding protein [Bacteroidales bacterium]|nr:CoA-binding protein [Bacteroidales bacterium]